MKTNRIKVADATGTVLNWLVAKADGYTQSIRLNQYKEWQDLGRTQVRDDDWTLYSPSTDPALAHPIIYRERIHLCPITYNGAPAWEAWLDGRHPPAKFDGPDPLVVAMRSFVASRLGDEVDVPEEMK